MSATAEKKVEKSNLSFDRKRMEKALKSPKIEVPVGLSKEEKRALILSQS